jgi:hypothetical protein
LSADLLLDETDCYDCMDMIDEHFSKILSRP